MSSNVATISGNVVSLPRELDPHQACVAIIQNEVEYRVLPRAAGVDLVDEVNVAVEATGLISNEDDIYYIMVRSYKVLEDDLWIDE